MAEVWAERRRCRCVAREDDERVMGRRNLEFATRNRQRKGADAPHPSSPRCLDASCLDASLPLNLPISLPAAGRAGEGWVGIAKTPRLAQNSASCNFLRTPMARAVVAPHFPKKICTPSHNSFPVNPLPHLSTPPKPTRFHPKNAQLRCAACNYGGPPTCSPTSPKSQTPTHQTPDPAAPACRSCASSSPPPAPTTLTISAPSPHHTNPFATLTTLHSFCPSPECTEGILTALSDPDATLRDIATHFETTLEALTAWMKRDDIQERLDNLDSAIAARTRLLATNSLALATRALERMITAYIDEEKHIPVRPNSIEDREQRRKARETALKAIRLLKQIATLPPSQPRARRSGSAMAEPGRGGQERPDQPKAPPRATINQLPTPSPQPLPPQRRGCRLPQ